MSDNTVTRQLLKSNKQWAEEFSRRYPDFFRNSATQPQRPDALWIGCADSRTPESVITASKPGAIFVQRNIANQFHLHDTNSVSVLAYAVDSLEVKNVIVVGHSDCGGADAALKAAQSLDFDPAVHRITTVTIPGEPVQESALSRWLEPLTLLAYSLRLPYDKESLKILIKENIKRQVENLAKSETIVNAWAHWRENPGENKPVYIHGWLYELGTGMLEDLNISRGPGPGPLA